MSNSKRTRTVFVKKSSVVATEFALALMAAQIAYAQQPPDQAAPQQQPPEQAAPQQQPPEQAAPQQQPAAAQPVRTAEQVERVEITGSRLPQLNVEGPSPVTVVGAQEIRMDGLSKTEDILLALPQVNAAQTSVQSNGATGTANVNLRNLGPVRNLVLVNGRRLPAGTPQSGAFSAAADLNQIPAPLIQRVEVLSGGASAVYGSDAITGVLNFIMNDRFEGLQVDLYHSFYNHQQHNPDGVQDQINARAVGNGAAFFNVPGNVGSDGAVNGVSFTMGKNFADNKGNATMFFGYKKEAAVSQANRDFSACSLNDGDSFSCAGSSTTYPGRFATNSGAGPSFTVTDAAGGIRPYTGATDAFNFGPFNFFRRPSEQVNANVFAHLDIHPLVRAYGELNYHDNKSDASIAQGGIFFGDPFVTIRGDNPLLSAAQRAFIAANNGGNPFGNTAADTATLLIGRRDIEGPLRTDSLRNTSFRSVIGAKGDLDPVWSYDTFFNAGNVIFSDYRTGFFDKQKIARAMDVTTDAGGAPVCRSVLDGTDPSCVPYDIWRIGGVSQAALGYLHTPALQTGETTLRQMAATATADLGKYGWKMPSARDGIALALGAEHRTERLTLQTDNELTSFGLSGSGGPQIGVSGQLSVDEWYTEARLPILQGLPLADLLSVNGSFRRSSYSTGKDTNTYGVGAEWAPDRAYRLRGSYQRAIRHANVNELFQPQGQNLFGLSTDPCSGTAGAPKATAAQCARTGLAPALYGTDIDSPAGQYNFFQGGNPDLTPEKASTYTVGFVMNPIRNFTASIDWYDIKIEEAIGASPAFVLVSCLNSGTNCNLVHRDSLGTLWADPLNGFVTALNTNFGSYHTSGIDFGANYTLPLGDMGRLGINGLATWLNKFEQEPIKGAGKFDCKGLYGPMCSNTGGPNPEWKTKVRGTWSTPWNMDFALTWRHISEVKYEATSSDPLLSVVGSTSKTNEKLAARDYFDIALQWNIDKTFSVRGGINNLLDKDPPLVGSGTADPSVFGNGNTFPGTYDALGRLFFANLTMKF
jgi:outer membrane receptor protein involved in Fe transport